MSLAMDTGACVNILSYNSFMQLRDRMPSMDWVLKPPDVDLKGVSGTSLM